MLMSTPLDDHLAEISALCRRFGVERLDLFGSAATDTFDPARSDIDLLVEFGSDAGHVTLDTYFDLKDALEVLLRRSVDLVMEDAIRNPYVRAEIERSKRALYAA
jgi:predicted nucleotidyltransferase